MDYIFCSKKKNIFAICFLLFYIVMLILKIDFRLPLFLNFRYTINTLFVGLTPMIAPICILALIFTSKKDYKFKTWLLPIAFGVNLILSVLTLILNLPNMQIKITLYGSAYLLAFFCSFLMCVAIALMFVGSLFHLRYIKLIKYGALGHAVLCLCSIIIDFIRGGGLVYIQSASTIYFATNIITLVHIISCALFYMGIFILTTNKKKTDLVQEMCG